MLYLCNRRTPFPLKSVQVYDNTFYGNPNGRQFSKPDTSHPRSPTAAAAHESKNLRTNLSSWARLVSHFHSDLPWPVRLDFGLFLNVYIRIRKQDVKVLYLRMMQLSTHKTQESKNLSLISHWSGFGGKSVQDIKCNVIHHTPWMKVTNYSFFFLKTKVPGDKSNKVCQLA